jgi:Short C-terminal domain
MLDALQKLGELKSAGVLTEAEFQYQKGRILAGG